MLFAIFLKYCWRESVKPIQFYCNTVPLSYMIDDRKLLFYRKISVSKNVILRTLMCLPVVSSDQMFLCSKYGVIDLLQPESVYELQLCTCLWHRCVYTFVGFLLCMFCVSCMIVFYVLP